ncbi:MAG TPA: serine hydrolase domain-containing protein [Nocardioidaceae bacterium]|nr:serine hydrolase domain-containing protein [Nocardioidaceae bacterium]
MPLPLDIDRSLRRFVAERQAASRVPGLICGIVRDGQQVWGSAAGAADVAKPERPPTTDTQYAIGSITKTFTATLIMALRDEGKLDLDDPLSRFFPETKHDRLTVRRMLAHASGLQREPVGDIWDTLVHPDAAGLLAGLEEAEQVLAARAHWHYSNLAYCLLGEIVARIDGRPWADVLRTRILEPLGMRRTSLLPEGEAAVGYFSEPFYDQVTVQPVTDLKATGPAGALWSTVNDLTRWAAFLVEGRDDVLRAETLEEMAQVQIMTDPLSWSMAWGLGFQLMRSGDRVLVGHTGGMPGFVTGLFVDRATKIGAIVLANTMSGFDPGDTTVILVTRVLDQDPPSEPTWRPGPPVPDDLAELVGRWWSEGSAFEFSVRRGRLEARMERSPPTAPPAVFERIDDATFRTVSGRERGELLSLTRGDDGAVRLMHWATYRVTREPESFIGSD